MRNGKRNCAKGKKRVHKHQYYGFLSLLGHNREVLSREGEQESWGLKLILYILFTCLKLLVFWQYLYYSTRKNSACQTVFDGPVIFCISNCLSPPHWATDRRHVSGSRWCQLRTRFLLVYSIYRGRKTRLVFVLVVCMKACLCKQALTFISLGSYTI